MGNEVAEVWQQVHEQLRTFIARRVGNEAEVQDIVQEVFVRVHRHLDQLKEPERFTSWVFQITRRVIIDYYRAPGRRELPVGLAEEFEDKGAATASETEPIGNAELSGCLRPMIARLSEEYRQAIVLVEIEGLTQKEAAARLGLSVPGMKSRVQRGRRQLKMLLNECCVIELDGRKGVVDFHLRRPDASPC